ncbi:MAG: ribokinase [Bacillota bacterium]
MEKADVVVYGTINMDLVATVERFPENGETIASSSFQEIPGGKAANQAVSAQRLQKQVALVGKIGADAFSNQLRQVFHKERILLKHLYTSKTSPTGSAIIIVDQNGQNMIITNQNANKELTIEEVKESFETAKTASAILLQPEMSRDVAHYIISTLKKWKIPIFLNLAPVVQLDPEIRRLVDFLIINEVEAQQLTGNRVDTLDEAEFVVKQLIDEGHSHVIITLGAKGAVIGSCGMIEHVPSPKVKSIDSTAAGDCFCGALVTYWLEHKNLLQATKLAVVAAAISVTKKGALPSLPSKKEVEAYIKKEKMGELVNEKMV